MFQAIVLNKYPVVINLMFSYCLICTVLSAVASFIVETDLSSFSLQPNTRLFSVLYSVSMYICSMLSLKCFFFFYFWILFLFSLPKTPAFATSMTSLYISNVNFGAFFVYYIGDFWVCISSHSSIMVCTKEGPALCRYVSSGWHCDREFDRCHLLR